MVKYEYSGGGVYRLNTCLKSKSFRSVFVYRIKQFKLCEFILIMNKILLPRLKTIEINGDIGKGLLVSHNFSVIYTERTGDNFRVGPGVVIGRNGKGFPIIGNNVYIGSNSTVIGNIQIGNNVIVGAGSVVVKNIPDNSVVVGNPARIIRNIYESDYNEILP